MFRAKSDITDTFWKRTSCALAATRDKRRKGFLSLLRRQFSSSFWRSASFSSPVFIRKVRLARVSSQNLRSHDVAFDKDSTLRQKKMIDLLLLQLVFIPTASLGLFRDEDVRSDMRVRLSSTSTLQIQVCYFDWISFYVFLTISSHVIQRVETRVNL